MPFFVSAVAMVVTGPPRRPDLGDSADQQPPAGLSGSNPSDDFRGFTALRALPGLGTLDSKWLLGGVDHMADEGAPGRIHWTAIGAVAGLAALVWSVFTFAVAPLWERGDKGADRLAGDTTTSVPAPPTTEGGVGATTPTPRPGSGPFQRQYLMDLPTIMGEWRGGMGFRRIGGKEYSKALFANICIVPRYRVEIPAGASRLVGSFGYTDGNRFADGTAAGNEPLRSVIWYSTDSVGSDMRWIRLSEHRIKTRGVTEFDEPIPAGATAVTIAPSDYACSTTVGWGDPRFE